MVSREADLGSVVGDPLSKTETNLRLVFAVMLIPPQEIFNVPKALIAPLKRFPGKDGFSNSTSI